jgi:hypothetical protein
LSYTLTYNCPEIVDLELEGFGVVVGHPLIIIPDDVLDGGLLVEDRCELILVDNI